MMEVEQVQQEYNNITDNAHLQLKSFFARLESCREVGIVDLGGGPGCSAVGVSSFLKAWLGAEAFHQQVTLLDPVRQWEWCSKALGFLFRCSPTLTDMLAEDCTGHADILLLGWALDFADNSFWQAHAREIVSASATPLLSRAQGLQ